MSLRYALLALLRVGPLSGYELQKLFAESVGHVWHAPDSQIYPELKRMESDGLITGEEQTRGQRGRRRVYHVTDRGGEDFFAWANAPMEYSRVRDPAHLRAAYLESASDDAARDFLTAHARHHRELLRRWRDEIARIRSGEHPMVQRRLAAIPEQERERAVAFKVFAYEGLAQRAEAEIRWAEQGLQLLNRLAGEEAPVTAG
ncbi:DNA-binding PadR family transcriptional regulator [Microbacterium ginsengiterrae]|uniref:DNA-binding PadR family transcriptional regulator n=1 Tax=Microbacterium ginsengiterrae TaxID=546115 RepID=A0A7W9CC43_9MICO|nr:PadR family transcriptional regulator [Microbacterium ginsengiterrae]MBB5742547.1 DNA-binding PadR family transcriptional regulator [Microbacterium ginsengiterrae]